MSVFDGDNKKIFDFLYKNRIKEDKESKKNIV